MMKFVVDTQGWPGVLKAKKIENFSKKKIPRATPGSSASIIYNVNVER